MGEFFKGWRRKAGLVTLAMACVLAVVWMRSSIVDDNVFVPQKASRLTVVSAQGHLGYVRHTDREPVERFIWESTDISDLSGISVIDTGQGIDCVTWQWTLGGFRCGAAKAVMGITGGTVFYGEEFEFCFTPYWSLVLPLTLLSAWLILGKTRKAKGGG